MKSVCVVFRSLLILAVRCYLIQKKSFDVNSNELSHLPFFRIFFGYYHHKNIVIFLKTKTEQLTIKTKSILPLASLLISWFKKKSCTEFFFSICYPWDSDNSKETFKKTYKNTKKNADKSRNSANQNLEHEYRFFFLDIFLQHFLFLLLHFIFFPFA